MTSKDKTPKIVITRSKGGVTKPSPLASIRKKTAASPLGPKRPQKHTQVAKPSPSAVTILKRLPRVFNKSTRSSSSSPVRSIRSSSPIRGKKFTKKKLKKRKRTPPIVESSTEDLALMHSFYFSDKGHLPPVPETVKKFFTLRYIFGRRPRFNITGKKIRRRHYYSISKRSDVPHLTGYKGRVPSTVGKWKIIARFCRWRLGLKLSKTNLRSGSPASAIDRPYSRSTFDFDFSDSRRSFFFTRGFLPRSLPSSQSKKKMNKRSSFYEEYFSSKSAGRYDYNLFLSIFSDEFSKIMPASFGRFSHKVERLIMFHFFSRFLVRYKKWISFLGAGRMRLFNRKITKISSRSRKRLVNKLITDNVFSLTSFISIRSIFRRLFRSRRSPFVSARHLLWAKNAFEFWAAKYSRFAPNFYKYYSFYDSWLFSKKVFWKRNPPKTFSRSLFNRWHGRLFYTCRYYLTKLKCIKFSKEAKREAGRNNFIAKRRRNNMRQQISRLSAGIKFWRVNYGKVRPSSVSCYVWDHSQFKMVNRSFRKFVDPFGDKQSPFVLLNKVFAKYTNISVIGKLVFAYFLKSFYAALSSGKSAPFMEKLRVTRHDAVISVFRAYERFKGELMREKRALNRELDLSYLCHAGAMFCVSKPGGYTYSHPSTISRPAWLDFVNSRSRKRFYRFMPLWGFKQERFKIIRPFLRDRKYTLGENTPRNFCIASEKSPNNFSSFYPGNKGALVRFLDSLLNINNTLKTPVSVPILKKDFDRTYRVYKFMKLLKVVHGRVKLSRTLAKRRRWLNSGDSSLANVPGARSWFNHPSLFRARSYKPFIERKRRYRGGGNPLPSASRNARRRGNRGGRNRRKRIAAWRAARLKKLRFYHKLKSLKTRSFLSTGRYKKYPGFFYYFSVVRPLHRKISDFSRYPLFFEPDLRKSLKEDITTSNEFSFRLEMKWKSHRRFQRHPYIFYLHKRRWHDRKFNKCYKFINAVTNDAYINPRERLRRNFEVHAAMKHISKMYRPSSKHFQLKIYLRHIMRRQWNNTTQNLLTRWLSFKKKKRKWMRYFQSTHGRLGGMLWLLGFADDRKGGDALVTSGLIRVNSIPCANVNYIVRPYDVITLDRQAFDFLNARLLSSTLRDLLISAADAPTVERRRLIDTAHEELKVAQKIVGYKNSAAIRLAISGLKDFIRTSLSAKGVQFMARQGPRVNPDIVPDRRLRRQNRGRNRSRRPFMPGKREHVPFALRYDLTDTVVKSSSYQITLKIRRAIEDFLKHVVGKDQLFEKVLGDKLFLRIENSVIVFRPPSSANEMFYAFRRKPNRYYNRENSDLWSSDLINAYIFSRFWY